MSSPWKLALFILAVMLLATHSKPLESTDEGLNEMEKGKPLGLNSSMTLSAFNKDEFSLADERKRVVLTYCSMNLAHTNTVPHTRTPRLKLFLRSMKYLPWRLDKASINCVWLKISLWTLDRKINILSARKRGRNKIKNTFLLKDEALLKLVDHNGFTVRPYFQMQLYKCHKIIQKSGSDFSRRIVTRYKDANNGVGEHTFVQMSYFNSREFKQAWAKGKDLEGWIFLNYRPHHLGHLSDPKYDFFEPARGEFLLIFPCLNMKTSQTI